MAVTKLVLDRQAEAQNFTFGSASASDEALVVVENGTAASTNLVLDVKGTADIDGDLGVGGDLTLGGNLNITGDINSQSVTDLDVEDRTITLNSGGTTPTDDTSGIVFEGTSAATIAALYYNSASATSLTVGDGTTQVDVVGDTSTQTLTNKTLTTPTIGDFSNATHTHQDGSNGGQLSITSATTGTLTVARGGTGVVSTTAYAVLAGGTTATGALQSVSGVGTSGEVLTSNGAGALPTWQAASGGGSFSAVTVTGTQDSSNKTFTLGSTIASSDQIFLNGQLLTEGASNDYTISGTTLTFTSGFTAPASTDVIKAYGNV